MAVGPEEDDPYVTRVLAKESAVTGTTSGGYAGTASKSGTATKSVIPPKSDAGDGNQPQDKPEEYLQEQPKEQGSQCGAPYVGEQARSPAVPMMSRQKRERRLSCKDVQEIEVAEDEVKIELGAPRSLLVSGNQRGRPSKRQTSSKNNTCPMGRYEGRPEECLTFPARRRLSPQRDTSRSPITKRILRKIWLSLQPPETRK
ncbi:uncharacterized protein [Dermacentor albipictus]|uniref:uncharacterized protein isoform X2 n=1 Tax=Dermacentor albipictus TaxID=60249 RepID=UPI0038FCA382